MSNQRHREEQDELKKAFTNVFTTPEGKIVLDALKEQYYDFLPKMCTNEEAQYILGCRAVLADILSAVEQEK